MEELARYIDGLAELSTQLAPLPITARRKRWRAPAIALVVVLVATVGAAVPLVVRKSDDAMVTASEVVAEYPALVIVDTDLRLHAQGAGGSPWTSDLDGMASARGSLPVASVTQDRGSFFISEARSRTPAECGTGRMVVPEVVEVDVASHARRSFGLGAAPRLSPDGRWLAFLGLTSRGSDCSADQLVIKSTSDAVRRVYPLVPTAAGPQDGLDLWWIPDGSGVVVASTTGDGHLLRALTMTSGQFRDVRMPDGMDFAGFLGRPDIALGVTQDESDGSSIRGVWKIDLERDQRLEKLFDAKNVFDSNTLDGFVDGVLPNAEGDEVLITQSGDERTPTSLFIWRQSDPKPVALLDRAVSAAWVAGPAR